MLQYPLSEIMDRRSIVRLKCERIGGGAFNDEFDTLHSEVFQHYSNLPNDLWSILNDISADLYRINGEIWDLEADIRKGKEGELGLEEVGRRAIAIRDLNNKRVACKNEIVLLTKTGFVDVKKDHASE